MRVYGNKAGGEGGGVYIHMGEFRLSGSVKIKGNKNDAGAKSNVFLGDNDWDVFYFDGPMDPDTDIGVTAVSRKTYGWKLTRNTFVKYADLDMFFCDDPGHYLSIKDDELYYNESNTADLAGYSLLLNGYVGVKYYIDLDPSLRNSDTKVTFKLDSKVSELASQEVAFDGSGPEQVEGKTYYTFTCYVPAAEVYLPISATLKNGSISIKFDDFTVRDYALYLIENSSGKNKTIAENLMNYGYYSASNFGVSGADSSDKIDLTEPSWTTKVTVPEGTNIKYYGSSISFLEGTRIKHYFEVTGGDISDFSFKIGGTSVEPVKNGKYYYIETPETVPISDAQTPVTVTVSGKDSIEFDYSPANYVAAVLDNAKADSGMKDLVKAYYMYYTAVMQ